MELHVYAFVFLHLHFVYMFSLCRNYTQLFEPIVIDDEDPTPNEAKAEPPEEPVLVI